MITAPHDDHSNHLAPMITTRIHLTTLRSLPEDRPNHTSMITAQARRVEAELRRRREIFPGSMVDHRWIGSIRTSQRSFAVFDAYATEALALSELSLLGGEESQQLGGQGGLGGWMIAEFHHQVMRPAIAALTAADVDGETLVSRGGYKKQTSLLNSTTYTYMADVCLEVSQKPGQMPSVKFGLMGGYVCE